MIQEVVVGLPAAGDVVAVDWVVAMQDLAGMVAAVLADAAAGVGETE